ncbi:MAG TPA: hypothetical protein VEX11_09365, partial [Acetobacteraceae bacterium]|nr:hypothetical protein [Acetobacteraceae bacterium]
HGSKRKLSFHATLLPSLMEGYRSATVLAADAGETALVHLWAGRVRFREARHLDRHLRYTTHPNGSLLTVEYISEEDWSKRHRDKRAEDGRPLLDHAVEAVRRRFGEAEFAWMGNLDLGDDLFGDARATRLPNTSHGLNSFTHLHNAALLSALNPPPAHFAFLDSIGIGGDAVRTALYRQAIYQAACRTSLRDPTDATPKCIVVPDRATAAWLAEKFPGCQVGAIAGVPALAKGRQGRPRLHESPAMRDRQHREAERDRLLADVLALRKQELERQREITPRQAGLQAERQHGLAPRQAGLQAERQHGLAPAGAPPIPDSRCDENTIRGRDSVAAAEQAEAPPRVFATLYASLRDTDPAHHLACSDWREFVAALRLVWQDSISGKGATARFIPAHVDPAYSAAAGAAVVVADETWSTYPGASGGHDGAASPQSRRGGDNVRSAHVLALDNDGGDLAKEEFARLVPWRMLIVNSYSSRPGAERWRALIPTDVPVTAELYRLFTGRLLKRLNRAGYWSNEQLADNPRIKSRLRHGFDTVKLGAASIFDLPSQAGAGPEASFFLDLTDGREAIDVDRLIRWLDLRRGDTAERLRALQDAQSAFDALAPEQQAAMQRSVRAAVWAEMSDEDRAAFPEFDPERAA